MVLFLLQKAKIAVTTRAMDGTTVLHRVAAASVRALEQTGEQAEEKVLAISSAAGAWLSLLAILLKHCGEQNQDSQISRRLFISLYGRQCPRNY